MAKDEKALLAPTEKSDGKCKVKALRQYSARGVFLREGDEADITVAQAKLALVSHPVSPPIKIIGGLDKDERADIDEFVDDYNKRYKANKNEGAHHTKPATP